MSTVKQIEANRLNALKHGLFAHDLVIPGEDPAHLEALRTSHYDRFQPATAEEHVLVAALVRNAWKLERCSNSETAVWVHSFERYKERDHRLSRCETANASDLMHLQRRIDSAERNYRRGLDQLLKLQAARQKAAPAPEHTPELTAGPNPQPKSPQPVKPENGFVPANSISTPPAPPAPARPRVTFPILGPPREAA